MLGPKHLEVPGACPIGMGAWLTHKSTPSTSVTVLNLTAAVGLIVRKYVRYPRKKMGLRVRVSRSLKVIESDTHVVHI